MSKTCIVCGKTIAKRTHSWYFQRPTREETANVLGRCVKIGTDHPPGSVDRGDFMSTIYMASEHRPGTIDELRRYTNHEVVSTRRDSLGRIDKFSTWDGESYRDPYFHANRCAERQGYASADSGDRFRWRIEE